MQRHETTDSHVFSRSDLLELLDDYEPPYISLFMPTHVASPDRKQDAIRLSNLIRQAESLLGARRVAERQTRQLLGRLEELTSNSSCWEHRSHGLAVFATVDFFRCYSMPLSFEENVFVDDHFHISPLIPMLHANGRFFVLALTKDSADLYEATRFSMVERELPPLASPDSEDRERSLQYRSHQIAGGVDATGNGAIFHGHGGAVDRDKDATVNFFKREVEPAVSFALRDQRAPLVLACVDSLASLYAEANSYAGLCDQHISGSPISTTQSQLREKGWEIVAPSFRDVEDKARRSYETLCGSKRTQAKAAPILEAARRGRVDTLFLPCSGRRAQLASSVTGLVIEEAAEQTLLFGGQVIAVEEMPEDAQLAAVLRY